MSTWSPTSALAQLVYAGGFLYDPSQDIIYSRMDALQRNMGYGYLYDVSALPMEMVIDCEPIFFTALGKMWMVELWKGQYGLETGCEVGVYNRPIPPPACYPILDTVVGTRPYDPAHGYFYQCVDDADRMTISYTLYRKGQPLFTRGPELHWWLTGFKWGVYSTPDQLTMDITFSLPPGEVHTAFAAALTGMGYAFTDDGTNIRFTFATPVAPQVWTNNPLLGPIQAAQQTIVQTYQSWNLPNNDPNTIPAQLAQGLGSSVAVKTADFLGSVLAAGLRNAGQTAAQVGSLIASELNVAAETVQGWVTTAGYNIVQWVQAVYAAFQQAFTMNFSTAVEVHNVTFASSFPCNLTLVASDVSEGSWVVPPPAAIPAGTVARFYLKDNLGLFGSSGSATYQYVDIHGQGHSVTLTFGCPTGLSSNFAQVSQPSFTVYAKSGAGTPTWGGPGQVPGGGHPLYVAYVWAGGPAPN